MAICDRLVAQLTTTQIARLLESVRHGSRLNKYIHSCIIRKCRLGSQSPGWVTAAVVDLDVPKTRRFAAEMGYTGQLFASLEEYLAWGGTKATMIVTRTESRYCSAVALGPELEAKSHFAYVFAHQYGIRVC